jgi:hypothetical protein
MTKFDARCGEKRPAARPPFETGDYTYPATVWISRSSRFPRRSFSTSSS